MKRTVLLVDDEPGLAIAIQAALEAENLACEAVTDTSAAIRYLQEKEAAVLVIDIMMPSGPDYPDIVLISIVKRYKPL